MSALLPIHGSLPAAVALAIGSTPPATAHADGVQEVRRPAAAQPSSLKAIRDFLDPQSFQVLRWVAELQNQPGRRQRDLCRHPTGGESAHGPAQPRRYAGRGLGGRPYGRHGNASGRFLGRTGADAIGAGRLTAFALRASARMPSAIPATARDGAEAAIYAALQPLYDQVSAFRTVEARLVLGARRAALKADAHAMVARNYQMLRVAKTELGRASSARRRRWRSAKYRRAESRRRARSRWFWSYPPRRQAQNPSVAGSTIPASPIAGSAAPSLPGGPQPSRLPS